MSSPRLSVIVPALNEALGISATVDRLRKYLDEVHPSWELIVVDDGSVDDTVRVVERLAEHDQRVGIEWHCRIDSRVSPWRGAAAFADILRVRWNGWRGRYQAVPAPVVEQPADSRVCC